jgi:hypothetical protein
MSTHEKLVQDSTSKNGCEKPSPESDRWKHRRKLAYLSFCGLVAGMSSGIYIESESIINTSIAGFVAIIGAYVGFATWGDKK